MSVFCCEKCQTECTTKPTKNGNPRVPNGWKQIDGVAYCKKCWKSRYLIRSVSFPVVGPVEMDWKAFGPILKTCWAQSTGLANWAVTEMLKADTVRLPNDQELGHMPYVYLYPGARQRFPEMAAKSVVTLLHNVEQKYRKSRLSVIWRSDTVLQRFRYPFPFPVNNKGWTPFFDEKKCPNVSVFLCGERITLRLRGGQCFRRQLAVFSQIISGKAIPCDLAIYRQPANTGDHRSGVADKHPGGGQKRQFRVMVKMTAWIPKPLERKDRDGILSLSTGPSHFLKATTATRDPWIFNADHVRRWVTRHRKMLDRVAEDRKFEKRWPKRQRRQMNDYTEKRIGLHHRRLTSFCKEMVAMVSGLANRQNVQEVKLDCTDESYLPEFSWSTLIRLLESKLDEFGITLSVIRSEPESEQKLAA